ncbi:MAG: metallophosphoesterase family protein, partial [bacterium]
MPFTSIALPARTFTEKMHPKRSETITVITRHKNIVMLHGDITNLNSIPLSMLKERNIDYLALGHIHKFQKGKLDDRGIWVYPGCLEGRGFDEEGPKG